MHPGLVDVPVAMEPLQQEWYSVEEAAELCRCSERLMLLMVKRCEIAGQRHGKSVRFHREELEGFIERCERTGSWPGERRN